MNSITIFAGSLWSFIRLQGFALRKINVDFYVKKSTVCCALVALSAVTSAQDIPKVEIFGGYSYLRATGAEEPANLHGWNAALNVNLKNWSKASLGVVADVSGNYGTSTVVIFSLDAGSVGDLKTKNHNFLFGPQIQLHGSRVAPFARVMTGAARRQFSGLLSGSPVDLKDNAFAFGTGGGVDVKVNKRVWLRLVQADYLMTRFEALDQSTSKTQHHLRLSAGLVIRLR